MTPRIRHFIAADLPHVERIQAACHPTWPTRILAWWWSHPTLVLEVDGQIIGSTSVTVSMAPAAEIVKILKWDRAEIGWGKGVNVDPDWRGQGYGWRLAQARHQVLKDLGIEFFFGQTHPDNKPMQAIFARQQLTRGITLPDLDFDGEPGTLFHGRIV
jgi:GNAT superfamily N-acetyltransferase